MSKKPDADGAMFADVVNRLQSSSARADSDFKMTHEEGERLLEAFKKPEFRAMFKDYVDEISDPKNRAEYEEHLKQMERESMIPEDKQLMRPKAGFCVKTKTQDGNKVFINICHHEMVDEPTVESSAKGQQWSLPNTLGPPRMEKDNRGTPCVTFDLAFHSKALSMAVRSKQFKNMLCEVAIEQVETKYREFQRNGTTTLSKKYHILKKVACLGGSPATMTLSKKRKPSESKQEGKQDAPAPKKKANSKKARRKRAAAAAAAAKAQAASAPPSSSSPSSSAPAAASSQSAAAGRAKKSKGKSKSKSKAAAPSSVIQEELPAGVSVPAYKVVHRGEFDMGGFGINRESNAVKRPKELVVKIDLPALKSVRGVELDVSERELSMVKSGKYQLKLRLPYPVDDTRAGARFVKDKRRLIVTIPVKAPPKPAAKPFVAPEPEVDDSEDTATEAAQKPMVPSKSKDQSRWVSGTMPKPKPLDGVPPTPPAASTTSDSTAAAVPATPPAIPAAKASGAKKAGTAGTTTPSLPLARCPAVTWREGPTKVTILVPVAGVDSASASLVCRSSSEVSVTMRTAPPSASRYAFVVHCNGDIDVNTARLDVSSDNVVLLFTKKEAGMWNEFGSISDQVEAGAQQGAAAGLEETKGSAADAATGAGAGAGAGGAPASYIAAKSWQGVKSGYYFGCGAEGVGYYWDAVVHGPPAAGGASSGAAKKKKSKALPAVRKSTRVVTHATKKTSTSAASSQPKRPHPLTGAPELNQPGKAAAAAAAAAVAAPSTTTTTTKPGPDLSAVNLKNTTIFEID